MSARDQLAALYKEWHRLTLDEGGAIVAGAWPQVDQIQTSKQALQSQIIAVSQRLQEDWALTGGQRMQEEPYFRQLVEELLHLEARNSELIGSRRREAEQLVRELDKATRSLRQVHKTYSSARDSSWNSYS